MQTRANGLLADITALAGNQQLRFFSLYGVKLSRTQEAKQKLLDIHILCTDAAAHKLKDNQTKILKQEQAPLYHDDVAPLLTGYARVISYIAGGPDLKL